MRQYDPSIQVQAMTFRRRKEHAEPPDRADKQRISVRRNPRIGIETSLRGFGVFFRRTGNIIRAEKTALSFPQTLF